MQRSDGRATKRQRPENVTTERAAGMQDDFPLPLLTGSSLSSAGLPRAKPRQCRRSFTDQAIGRGDQDQIGGQNGVGKARLRRTSSDIASGDAGATHGARNHRANPPASFTQSASQQPADPTRSDDGHGGRAGLQSHVLSAANIMLLRTSRSMFRLRRLGLRGGGGRGRIGGLRSNRPNIQGSE